VEWLEDLGAAVAGAVDVVADVVQAVVETAADVAADVVETGGNAFAAGRSATHDVGGWSHQRRHEHPGCGNLG